MIHGLLAPATRAGRRPAWASVSWRAAGDADRAYHDMHRPRPEAVKQPAGRDRRSSTFWRAGCSRRAPWSSVRARPWSAYGPSRNARAHSCGRPCRGARPRCDAPWRPSRAPQPPLNDQLVTQFPPMWIEPSRSRVGRDRERTCIVGVRSRPPLPARSGLYHYLCQQQLRHGPRFKGNGGRWGAPLSRARCCARWPA